MSRRRLFAAVGSRAESAVASSGLRRPRRGFTLLEVLLALCLMAGLMLALNTFVFSMAEVWGKGRDERLFAQHARAVSAYVEELLRSASLGPEGSGLAVKEVRQETGGDAPELVFTMAEGSRLLSWPETPLPDVEMSFAIDKRGDKGLVLHWQSLLETRRDTEAPRTTVISPFVTSVGWDYYDESFKRWETLDDPKRETDGTYVVPKRLRLRFAHGKMTLERILQVPVRMEGVTDY